MTDKDKKIFNRLQHDRNYVESLGYKVFGVFLQGSQNYGLDYEGSDIDTKCIVMPKFEDIVLNKQPSSTTLVLDDNSHVDRKDIRLMWDCFLKQNINFVEILFTKYFIVKEEYKDLWQQMQDVNERIAHYNNYATVNCITGMILEKNKALCHPYPTLKDKIEKFGFDPKQLHHIIRCEEFLNRYINGVTYKDCLTSLNPQYLIAVKSVDYFYSLEEAVALANDYTMCAKSTKEHYFKTEPLKIDAEVKDVMNNILLETLKRSLREEI